MVSQNGKWLAKMVNRSLVPVIFRLECRLAADDDFWLEVDDEDDLLQEFDCWGISQDELVDDEAAAAADADVVAGDVTVVAGAVTLCDAELETLPSDEFSFWSSRSVDVVDATFSLSPDALDADVGGSGPENHKYRPSNGWPLMKSKL